MPFPLSPILRLNFHFIYYHCRLSLTKRKMLKIDRITFGPFQENTYILHDGSKECVIVDPGCYMNEEKQALASFISRNELKPVKLLLTHSHIDHVMGNAFVTGQYNIPLEMNELDLDGLRAVPVYGQRYGLFPEPSPEPSTFLVEGDVVSFGNTELEVLFTPGHSPGSICFYHRESESLIAGDVLFRQSIGRTDLPGGNHQALIASIKTKLFPLGDNVTVYPGHGESTRMGYEKKHNPFLI
jgi:hydroxyacylglutathione hydrolase